MSELEIFEQPDGKSWEWISPTSGELLQYRLIGSDQLYLYTWIGDEWSRSNVPPSVVPPDVTPRKAAWRLIAPTGGSVMHGQPCWNGWCILGEGCDGTNHGDVTGHSWVEVRPEWLPEGERLSVRVYGTDEENS